MFVFVGLGTFGAAVPSRSSSASGVKTGDTRGVYNTARKPTGEHLLMLLEQRENGCKVYRSARDLFKKSRQDIALSGRLERNRSEVE